MSAPSGFIRHFENCHRHNPDHFTGFFVEGRQYGFVAKPVADVLVKEHGSVFVPAPGGVALAPTLDTYEKRSAALWEAGQAIAKRYGRAIRNEFYGIVGQWGEEAVAQVDRAIVPTLGLRAWGIHLNGFVRKPDGIHLWIGKRADDRPLDPGKLDNMVGGGMPLGITPEDNMCKEAKEESGMEESLARTAKLIGTMDYKFEREDGLRNDSLFLFDIELPESFTPQNTDGEVAGFYLKPLAEVAQIIRNTDQFKFNCNMVIIDFMMRHGFITPDDAEYDGLRKWLIS